MRMKIVRSGRPSARAVTVVALSLWACGAWAQPIVPRDAPPNFVNWETPHGGSPLCMTPDGARLLAVNTADNRLEVFSIGGIL